jgi:hypothetical protein
MRAHTLIVALLLAMAALHPGQARAGVYGDDLARCLVEKTSDSDKVLLAKWIFTIISAHPSAVSLAKVSEAERTAVARQTAGVFQTLLTDTCREQTVKAMKYEGSQALGSSFKVLGEIAMTTLMGDPAVAAQLKDFVQYLDEDKIKAVLGREGAD